MTSPDKSSGPAAGYLPDPLDVWSAVEGVYWSARTVSHPWAEALAALRDTYLGTVAAEMVVDRWRNPRGEHEHEHDVDPRPLVAYDLGRLVEGERAWPIRLTTALAAAVVELPYDMVETDARLGVRRFEFARRAQHALDCLAAGRVPDPAEADLAAVPLHAPGERPPLAPEVFRSGPHGALLGSAENAIRHAEEAAEAVREMTTDEDTGGPAAVPEWQLPEYEQTYDEAALWPVYLGEWATAALYVLCTDQRITLVDLFAEHLVRGRPS